MFSINQVTENAVNDMSTLASEYPVCPLKIVWICVKIVSTFFKVVTFLRKIQNLLYIEYNVFNEMKRNFLFWKISNVTLKTSLTDALPKGLNNVVYYYNKQMLYNKVLWKNTSY